MLGRYAVGSPSGGRRVPNATMAWISAYAAAIDNATVTSSATRPTRRFPSRGAMSAYAANDAGSAVCHATQRYVAAVAKRRCSSGSGIVNATACGTNTIVLNSVPHASTSSEGRRAWANCVKRIAAVIASPMSTAPP